MGVGQSYRAMGHRSTHLNTADHILLIDVRPILKRIAIEKNIASHCAFSNRGKKIASEFLCGDKEIGPGQAGAAGYNQPAGHSQRARLPPLMHPY